MDNRKIISARIFPTPKPFSLENLSEGLPALYVTLESGEEIKLFEYYPDEVSFFVWDVIGHDVDYAHRLFHKKDTDYLRS